MATNLLRYPQAAPNHRLKSQRSFQILLLITLVIYTQIHTQRVQNSMGGFPYEMQKLILSLNWPSVTSRCEEVSRTHGPCKLAAHGKHWTTRVLSKQEERLDKWFALCSTLITHTCHHHHYHHLFCQLAPMKCLHDNNTCM